MALQQFLGFGRLFSLLILYTVGRTPWMGNQSVTRPLSTYKETQAQIKHKQIFMSRVGFEPTISVF
jgi:hypothetical protein